MEDTRDRNAVGRITASRRTGVPSERVEEGRAAPHRSYEAGRSPSAGTDGDDYRGADGHQPEDSMASDPVNHPPHYNSDPSGVEAITICEHRNFCIGNALKYLWRSGLKGGGEKQIEDLRKSVWYIQREISRLERR